MSEHTWTIQLPVIEAGHVGLTSAWLVQGGRRPTGIKLELELDALSLRLTRATLWRSGRVDRPIASWDGQFPPKIDAATNRVVAEIRKRQAQARTQAKATVKDALESLDPASMSLF